MKGRQKKENSYTDILGSVASYSLVGTGMCCNMDHRETISFNPMFYNRRLQSPAPISGMKLKKLCIVVPYRQPRSALIFRALNTYTMYDYQGTYVV